MFLHQVTVSKPIALQFARHTKKERCKGVKTLVIDASHQLVRKQNRLLAGLLLPNHRG